MTNIWLKIILLTSVLSTFCITIIQCDNTKITTSPRFLTSSPKLPSVSNTQMKLHRPLLDGKIIGGYPINIEDAPYQVSLHFINHKCSGILIAKNWILTAGHCTTYLQPYHYSIYMGSSNIEKNDGLIVKIAELYRHPNYTKDLDYDFTLLKLVNYSSSGYNIGIAKLPEQNEEIPDGTKLRVTGWDKTKNNSISKEILKAVDVITINSTKCQEFYKNRGGITDRMFCAAYIKNDLDICHADSGSPIVIGDKAIGVASWGYGCTLSDYPSVYAKISPVRDWIKNTCGV